MKYYTEVFKDPTLSTVQTQVQNFIDANITGTGAVIIETNILFDGTDYCVQLIYKK
jgi:hypothetical protein